MKIGLLGGSFDPVHLGHIRIAQDAIASLQLDSFWFIPTKHNPWKENVTASLKNGNLPKTFPNLYNLLPSIEADIQKIMKT